MMIDFYDSKFIASTGLLIISVILAVAFLGKQKFSRQPLMPLSLFKAPNLAAGNIVMGLMAAAWIPLWFFLNLYLQQILHYSAFSSGLALLPMTLAIILIMVGFTGKLVQKFGFKKILVTGLVILGYESSSAESLCFYTLTSFQYIILTHKKWQSFRLPSSSNTL